MVRPLDGETLVYDLDTHQAHCLNDLAGRLWAASDGRNTVAAMQAAEARSEDEILHGLQMLADADLIVTPPVKEPTRRRSRTERVEGVEVRLFGPEDHVRLICVHTVRHGVLRAHPAFFQPGGNHGR